jgi:hypothetical protein
MNKELDPVQSSRQRVAPFRPPQKPRTWRSLPLPSPRQLYANTIRPRDEALPVQQSPPNFFDHH